MPLGNLIRAAIAGKGHAYLRWRGQVIPLSLRFALSRTRRKALGWLSMEQPMHSSSGCGRGGLKGIRDIRRVFAMTVHLTMSVDPAICLESGDFDKPVIILE